MRIPSVCTVVSCMFLIRRAYSVSPLNRIQSLVATKNFLELSKAICANGITSETDWKSVSDSVLALIEGNKTDKNVAALVPSLVIASAASGHGLASNHRHRISQYAVQLFEFMSEFDKVVFTIGCSQSGLRTPEVVDFVNRFLTEARESGFASLDSKFVPGLLLAVSTLGIDNQLAWNHLVAKLDIESLSPHDITQSALAIATSRTFPISTIERIIDAAVAVGADKFSFEDAVCLCHSLACIEMFHVDLFRSLLVRVSNAPSLDSDARKLMKQVVLSLFIDEKARAIPETVSPVVLTRLDKLFDWSLPEPQRHHGMIAGEIQQILSLSPNEVTVSSKGPVPVTSIADWTVETAKSVGIDRFYINDVPTDSNLFFHIDDETYIDISEGPLDPYLQVKHTQVKKCGMKLVWVRELEWLELDENEKKEFILSHVASR
jgi:hypothetical protein